MMNNNNRSVKINMPIVENFDYAEKYYTTIDESVRTFICEEGIPESKYENVEFYVISELTDNIDNDVLYEVTIPEGTTVRSKFAGHYEAEGVIMKRIGPLTSTKNLRYIRSLGANLNSVFLGEMIVEKGHLVPLRWLATHHPASINAILFANIASTRGSLKILKFLSEEYDILNRDVDSMILKNAAMHDRITIMKYIFYKNQKNISPDDISKAFCLAVVFDNMKSVKYLYKMGADIYFDNCRAFRNSLSCGYFEMTKWLYFRGCSFRKNAEQYFDLCISNGNVEIFEWLISNNAIPTDKQLRKMIKIATNNCNNEAAIRFREMLK